jgi:hypothetical protein
MGRCSTTVIVLSGTLLAVNALPGCISAQESRNVRAAPSGGETTSRGNSGHDHFVGYFNLPDRNWKTGEAVPGPGTLIPVLKHGNAYYSVCHGAEVPLKPSPQGLEWGPAPPTLAGTTIGYDDAVHEYYIRIWDNAPSMHGAWEDSPLNEPGRRRKLIPIDRPAWLGDATTDPPQTLDDFVGYYRWLWGPVVCHDIRKTGDDFFARTYDPSLVEDDEPKKLRPLESELGFVWSVGVDRDDHGRLIYNDACNRYEIVFRVDKPSPRLVHFPLVRIPFEEIGVPSAWGPLAK